MNEKKKFTELVTVLIKFFLRNFVIKKLFVTLIGIVRLKNNSFLLETIL